MKSGASASFDEPSRAIVEQALEWHMRLQEGRLSSDCQQACMRWRNEHPAHALAYARIEALWQRFEGLDAAPSIAALQVGLNAGRATARRLAAGSLALSVMFAAGLALANLIYGGLSPAALLADYRTGAGEQQTIALDDGSRMILSSRSVVDVEYSGAQRRIVLHEGEVLVEVAKDAGRPFIIETPHATARALGTRYLVRQEAGKTVVTVVESVVRACAPHASVSSCVDLHAGEQASVSEAGVSGIQRVDAVAAESWSTGMLLVDDRPLAEVLAELARHRPGLLHFDAAAFSGQRVSGVFPLRDTDKALEVLATTQPVALKRFMPWIVTVEPR
jgi:transmembrane sensor